MTSTNQEPPTTNSEDKQPNQPVEAASSNIPPHSATTPDQPVFGWSAYAERVNGRFAMIGFTAILLIEAFSQDTFLHWAGLIP